MTLSIVIEDRDEYGDLRAYHKHEVSDPRAIVQFCHYLVRTPELSEEDIVSAASDLLELHSEACEDFKREEMVEPGQGRAIYKHLSRT